MERGIKIVSGGTDNHMMLVDLTNLDLTGKETEKLLDEAHITCNKNTIPNDPKSPFVTSGIRLGTPAVTSRGLNEEDMVQIAEAISIMLHEKDAGKEKAMAIVKKLTDQYPLIGYCLEGSSMKVMNLFRDKAKDMNGCQPVTIAFLGDSVTRCV